MNSSILLIIIFSYQSIFLLQYNRGYLQQYYPENDLEIAHSSGMYLQQNKSRNSQELTLLSDSYQADFIHRSDGNPTIGMEFVPCLKMNSVTWKISILEHAPNWWQDWTQYTEIIWPPWMQAVTGLQNSAHKKIFNSGLDDSQHKCIRPSFFLSQGTIRSENYSARSPFKISLQTPKLYILRRLSWRYQGEELEAV